MALRDNVRPKVPDTATERALLDGRGAFLGFLIKRLYPSGVTAVDF